MPSRLLDLPGRLRCRILREFRRRAGGLDVAWDHWIYEQFQVGGNPHDRLLRWVVLAPWNGPLPRNELIPQWASQGEAAAVVAAAERARTHEFDLLGSGPVSLGRQIDWHCDFKSGYRWDPALHHAEIRRAGLPVGVDIKVPWELSRCMHFAVLGLADWITDDECYYAEWKAQLRDWIAANPIGRGVNWSCAMDVGMRAVNWLNAVMMFGGRIRADQDCAFFALLSESLWHHGLHIERNLEWSGPRGESAGNHFLADLTGLLAIGGFFRKTRKGDYWWRFAQHWIEHEMFRQVNPDGTNFETSTSYHRMVMEMFLWSNTMTTRMREPFSAAYRERLDLMADFVAAYTAPGGVAAQFGDNDSGRLLWAGLDDGSDHRYLTRGECGFGGKLNRLLLTGNMVVPDTHVPSKGSFPDGGFYFMRQGMVWAGLRAGAITHGGAHSHCDQLSFVLNIAGKDIIVDRGTGVYTPDPATRNRYRSTSAHNTVQINGWEQNGFDRDPAQVFQMPDHAQGRMVCREEGPEMIECVAEHRGFGRHRHGLSHSRKVRLTCNHFAIEDSFQSLQPGDRLEWHFHFAPKVACQLDGNSLHMVAGETELLLSWNFPAQAAIRQVSHSPAYGVEVPSSTLTVTAQAPVSCVFLFSVVSPSSVR